MRSILREYPRFSFRQPVLLKKRWMTDRYLFKTILSGFAKTRDARMGAKQKRAY